MASFNQVYLIGRLGKDPEFGMTSNGVAYSKFSLAVDDFKTKGEKTTQWFNILVWDKLAETCEKYLNKGMLIFCQGKIQQGSYTDKEGIKRYTFEIVMSQMQMLEAKNTSRTVAEETLEYDGLP